MLVVRYTVQGRHRRNGTSMALDPANTVAQVGREVAMEAGVEAVGEESKATVATAALVAKAAVRSPNISSIPGAWYGDRSKSRGVHLWRQLLPAHLAPSSQSR